MRLATIVTALFSEVVLVLAAIPYVGLGTGEFIVVASTAALVVAGLAAYVWSRQPIAGARAGATGESTQDLDVVFRGPSGR